MSDAGALDGRVALVTGGAGDIGTAICRMLVAQGARVMIADVRADAGEALAGEIGAAARFAKHDVTSEDSWARVVEQTEAALGPVDTLVNNAGLMRGTPLVGGSAERYLQIVMVNQVGVHLGMRAVAPGMQARGSGCIVNISSIDGMVGMAQLSAYVASKWAVRGMTKVAALELGPLGIRCNSVHPGYIDTLMLSSGGRLDADGLRALAGQVPLDRLGRGEDVAGACAYLMSDAAAYCNGTELVVDGGLTAGIRPGRQS